MNEKYHQYYNLINDKCLIGQHSPSQSEIQEFDAWKEKKLAHNKKSSKTAVLVISFMIAFIIMIRSYF